MKGYTKLNFTPLYPEAVSALNLAAEVREALEADQPVVAWSAFATGDDTPFELAYLPGRGHGWVGLARGDSDVVAVELQRPPSGPVQSFDELMQALDAAGLLQALGFVIKEAKP
jgi:hypothetical protein